MLECHPWGEVMKKGIIITLLGGTFWGISGTMGQFLFQTYHLNTMWLTTLRMIFAGIILLSVCFIKDPSLEVITIFFRTTFKPFLSICRFYRLFLYF